MGGWALSRGRRRFGARRLGLLGLCCCVLGTVGVTAQEEDAFRDPGAGPAIPESRLDRAVDSADRSPRSVRTSAASVFVLTGEDIRRSGARSIPDALRLVPGVHVASIERHQWSISIRGFGDQFANKVVVMVDGRRVNSPLFGHVYWDTVDTLLEDVDRIEIIRGPAGSVWGADAMNGVIHIITKSSARTHGAFVEAGYGTVEQGFGGFRIGGPIGTTGNFRFWGKGFNRETGYAPGGAHDDWRQRRTGIRTDWIPWDGAELTVAAESFECMNGESAIAPSLVATSGARGSVDDIDVSGGHYLAKLTHRFTATHEIAANVSFDWFRRDTPLFLSEDRDTFAVDLEQRLRTPGDTRFTWGVGYRVSRDEIGTPQDAMFTLGDPERTVHELRLFARTDLALAERLRVSLGSALEYRSLGGVDVMPTVRAWWQPSEAHVLWAGVSRSTRMPTRAERDMQLLRPALPGPIFANPMFPVIVGTRDFDSETAVTAELGYRVEPHPALSVDVSAFFTRYDDLRGTQSLPFQPSSAPGTIAVPLLLDNSGSGDVGGFEVYCEWRPTSALTLGGGYSLLRMNLDDVPSDGDPAVQHPEDRDPSHLATATASYALTDGLRFDVVGRYVDRSRALRVPAWVQVDAQLAWAISNVVEVSIVGRNLGDPRQPEYRPTIYGVQPTEVKRSVYGMITLRW